jgi:hypothetical protein
MQMAASPLHSSNKRGFRAPWKTRFLIGNTRTGPETARVPRREWGLPRDGGRTLHFAGAGIGRRHCYYEKLLYRCISPAAVTVRRGKVERWAETAGDRGLRCVLVLENWSLKISKAGRRGGKLEKPPPFSDFCTAKSQTGVESPSASVETSVLCRQGVGGKCTGFPQETAYPNFPRGSRAARKSPVRTGIRTGIRTGRDGRLRPGVWGGLGEKKNFLGAGFSGLAPAVFHHCRAGFPQPGVGLRRWRRR